MTWQDIETMIDKARSFAFALCRDDHDTDDVMQEVRLTVWRNWKQVDPKAIRAYVYRAIHHRTIDMVRKREKRQFASFEDHGSETFYVDPKEQGCFYIKGYGSTKCIDEADARAELEMLVRRLPETYGEALLMELQGFDQAEAAQMIGCSTPAFKSRLNRGRFLARKMMEVKP